MVGLRVITFCLSSRSIPISPRNLKICAIFFTESLLISICLRMSLTRMPFLSKNPPTLARVSDDSSACSGCSTNFVPCEPCSVSKGFWVSVANFRTKLKVRALFWLPNTSIRGAAVLNSRKKTKVSTILKSLTLFQVPRIFHIMGRHWRSGPSCPAQRSYSA